MLKQTKCSSSTEALKLLHWLPICMRIKFKVMCIIWKSLHGLAPEYLKDLLSMNTNSHMNLRSSVKTDFPLGGGDANPRWRGRQPPTQALFGENICKNERIWSCLGGGGARRKLLYVDPPLVYKAMILPYFFTWTTHTAENTTLLDYKKLYTYVQHCNRILLVQYSIYI